MSDKPSAAWYLAPIFMGIIGSAIMWYVLKDEDHPDAPKMVKKGWIIGIVLTLISFAWIPLMLIPMGFMSMDQQHMQPIPVSVERMIEPKVLAPTEQSIVLDSQQAPSEKTCDPSYPNVCIPLYPPDLDCGEIRNSNFKVVGSDPHGFDGDNDGIGCES